MEEVLEKALTRRYAGRLAPSPTGALHLGNIRTFMVAWLRARTAGGRVVMRIEDLDHPRDKPGADKALLEELRILGFDWDEELRQSERRAIYREAIRALAGAGLAYPCVCSRRDVEAAQSAPHEGDQLFYPGTCRGRFSSWEEAQTFRGGALPCWRFRTPEGSVVSFADAFAGEYLQNVSATLGDFPLARDPDGAGYTLAATLDDLLGGVTEVVRGGDLLAATPAQILLARALKTTGVASAPPPRYCHVPLAVGPDGRRLAKRHGDTRIASFLASGVAPDEIIGLLAASCGWIPQGERITLPALASLLQGRDILASIPRENWVFGRDFLFGQD